MKSCSSPAEKIELILVDSNVLLDIFSDDATWRPWSEAALHKAVVASQVGINPIIYAETSLRFDDPEVLDRQLDSLLVQRLPLPYAAAFRAGRSFLEYRRSGGARSSPMPDFYIGAHAELEDLGILTRDVRRFRRYFPSVNLIAPTGLSQVSPV